MTLSAAPNLDEIAGHIIDCILKVKPIERSRLDPTVLFSDLGLSSIETMSVIFEVEEAFSIDLMESGHDYFRTVTEGAAIVAGLLPRK